MGGARLARSGTFELGVLALALLAACGASGDEASAASTEASADDAPAAPDSESAADALDDAILDGASDAIEADTPEDALTDDGALDALTATDSALDAAPDAAPAFCGDGIRALTEECDDGVVSPLLDSCSSLCEVRDLLAFRSAADASLPSRTLGLGRHPVAAGADGFAVAWVEPQGPTLAMAFYGPKGVPTGKSDLFGAGSTMLSTSAPVLAALPGGNYAAAWADMGGDGDSLGVALRLVDPNTPSVGGPAHANVTTAFAQYGADAVWTGTELVVAWGDTSNAQTGPDLRYRTFDATLSPTSGEQTLAASSAVEESVSLASFAGSWAAAWREGSGGLETVRVRAGGAAFSVGPFAPGPYGDQPGLAELDATHLLVVFAEGTGTGTAKLRGAVLDTAQPGVAVAFDLAPLVQPDAGVPLGIMRPAAVRAGARVFVAWATEAAVADPRGEELWIKEVSWNGAALDLTALEQPIPRWDPHRLGDQRLPALAATPLGPEGALAMAWMDLGTTFASEASGDVAVELMPVPVLRNLWADGGGL